MRIGISIVKSVSFRGIQQEFANVYHYDRPTQITEPGIGITDELVTMERSFHSTDVNFVRRSLWTAGGTPSQNHMIAQGTLSGTGNQGTNASMDRERAVLIQWRAGFDSRGHQVYLRKWYHPCGNAAGRVFLAAELQNTAELSGTTRGDLAVLAEAANEIGTLETWELCAASGRTRENGAQPFCHEYLEHHQLGDMWR